MALADSACGSCGAKAPEGRAALALYERADAAWDAGQHAEALARLERALAQGLPAEKLALARRKQGVWMEKLALEEGNPLLKSKAEQAYLASLEADFSDPITHQLFIAHHSGQGQAGRAAAYYQKRLEADPENAQAKRQLELIKLSSDLAATPFKSTLDLPKTLVERWLEPRPWKLFMAISTLLSSLAMVVVSLKQSPAAPSSDPFEGHGPPVLDSNALYDPSLWGLQAGLAALALIFMYRHRK
jgi:tetratricopeptide (TPR) repeat protein